MNNSNTTGVILIGCFCLLVVLVFKSITISEFVHFIVILTTVVLALSLAFLVGFCLAVKLILDTNGILLEQARTLKTTLLKKKILAMPLNSIVWLLTGKDSVVLLDMYINKFHQKAPEPHRNAQPERASQDDNHIPTKDVHNVVSPPPAGKLELTTVQERQKYRTKLLQAVKANNAPEIQRLFDTVNLNINHNYGGDSWTYSIDLGYRSVNMSVMHHACYDGHVHALNKLIELGANVNVCDENNATPLHIAIRRGHSECEAILCAHKDINFDIKDKFKKIPYLYKKVK